MMWGKTRYFKKNILLAFFYLLSIVYYICAYTRDISIDDYLMRIHYITLISNNIIIYYLYRKYSIYKSIHKSIIVRLMKHKFERILWRNSAADASLFVVSNYIVLCSFNVQYIQNTVLVILFLFANFILFLLLEGIVIYSITEDIHKIMLLLLVVLNLFFHYIFIPVAFL